MYEAKMLAATGSEAKGKCRKAPEKVPCKPINAPMYLFWIQ